MPNATVLQIYGCRNGYFALTIHAIPAGWRPVCPDLTAEYEVQT